MVRPKNGKRHEARAGKGKSLNWDEALISSYKRVGMRGHGGGQ
jgi:hypothetical protein